MNEQEYEAGLARAGEIQRAAGWPEGAIESYAAEHRAMTAGNYDCILLVGAGLAQNNSRHGVPKRDWLDNRDDADLEDWLGNR